VLGLGEWPAGVGMRETTDKPSARVQIRLTVGERHGDRSLIEAIAELLAGEAPL
jgi:hypothetical protein